MCIDTLFIQVIFITDYQDDTNSLFLVDKKLRVCRQEVNFLLANS